MKDHVPSRPWCSVNSRVFALAGVIFAVQLAISGCVKKSTHEATLAKLDAAESELAVARAAAEEKAAALGEKEVTLKTVAGELEKVKVEGGEKEAELGRVRGEKEATEAELAELKRQRDAAEKGLVAYRSLQAKLAQLVDTGRLDVSFRNGQMIINLPSRVLFPSGSADLSEEGLAALAEIASVLHEFRDRRFMIAGHTDNVPLRHNKKYKNNWYLSTARAIAVVEFLVDAGFAPTNLAASGYGEFAPVAPNDIDSNREQNRRIEIIIVPNLEAL